VKAIVQAPEASETPGVLSLYNKNPPGTLVMWGIFDLDRCPIFSYPSGEAPPQTDKSDGVQKNADET
jgi:hypothetical protein